MSLLALKNKITAPYVEDLLMLWDNPTDYTSISVDNSLAGLVLFKVTVEAPEIPTLEIELPLMIKGEA